MTKIIVVHLSFALLSSTLRLYNEQPDMSHCNKGELQLAEEGIISDCMSSAWLDDGLNMHRKPNCQLNQSSDMVDYGPSPVVDQQSNQKFTDPVRNCTLTETLYLSRHNCCYMNRKGGPPLDFPRSMHLFDWYYSDSDSGRVPRSNLSHPNPSTVLWSVQEVGKLLSILQKRNLPPLQPGQKRVLAFAQDDCHYSQSARNVKKIRDMKVFSRILWEAKDQYTEDVGTTPLGLNNFYLTRCDLEIVKEEMLGASFVKKSGGVLASWGGVHKGVDSVPNRAAANAFVSKSCLVSRRMLAAHDYWKELARHRFLLAPEGNGIQSPKVAEALTVLTIPIVHRNPATTDLLKKYKWPLVLVDSYEEVTPENLKKWFQDLSPQLVPFRQRLLAERALEDILNLS